MFLKTPCLRKRPNFGLL